MTSAAVPARSALLIPALNEAETIGRVLAQIPSGLFSQVIVVDNGSEDGTVKVARAAGACVVGEPRRGYGRACLAGLDQLHSEIVAVALWTLTFLTSPQISPALSRFLTKGGTWFLVPGCLAIRSPVR
jgi:cellulose synthase/poly-beta-1,6-N-acetylglucosamine synthase-like glycosyltransferase